jgi:S1-C subfamily serine protease
VDIYKERHQKVALPCVRIRTRTASGSGTIVYNQECDESWSTYILTNHHVVADCIKIEKKWSALAKAYIKKDVTEVVDADLFKYKWESRAIGAQTVQADIMAYDEDEDLALLKLKSPYKETDACAILYPRDEESNIYVGMPVIAIGAALGEEPVQTEGRLSQFGQIIENREFWLNSASIIFGNSGGSLYLKDTFQFVGIPSRVAVKLMGFSAQAITHLGYAIPITRIYDFFENQMFRFIYDEAFTEVSEAEARDAIRKLQERKLSVADLEGEDKPGGAFTPELKE